MPKPPDLPSLFDGVGRPVPCVKWSDEPVYLAKFHFEWARLIASGADLANDPICVAASSNGRLHIAAVFATMYLAGAS